MSTTSVHEYAAALRHMLKQDTPHDELLAAVDTIAETLVHSGRRSDLSKLLQTMEHMTDDGTPMTRVTTAQPLQKEERTSLGEDVREVADASLLAGARVLQGDRLVRSSLRDRLDTILNPTVLL